MTHLTDAYAPSNSGPYCTRQAHHYYRNPQHYVGPRGRHAWDPKLGSGVIFLKLTILILVLSGETKSAVDQASYSSKIQYVPNRGVCKFTQNWYLRGSVLYQDTIDERGGGTNDPTPHVNVTPGRN